MTPSELKIVKSLVAVAWADGKVEQPESGVIDGLLAGFGATEEEEREIVEYARTRRTLSQDLPLDELDREDRELLLANAALLTHADGEQSAVEREVLAKLIRLLEFSEHEARTIMESAKDGAIALGSKILQTIE
jgi:tellurite resistance protein